MGGDRVEALEARVREHVGGGGAVIFTSHQASRFGGLQHNLDLACYAV